MSDKPKLTDLKDLKELAEAALGSDKVLDSLKFSEALGHPPQTVLELIARVEAAEGVVDAKDAAIVAGANTIHELVTALEQAKAREAQQHNDIGILIAIINGVEEATSEGPDGEDAVLFSQITAAHNEAIDLRNAVTAMGGDDGGS